MARERMEAAQVTIDAPHLGQVRRRVVRRAKAQVEQLWPVQPGAEASLGFDPWSFITGHSPFAMCHSLTFQFRSSALPPRMACGGGAGAEKRGTIPASPPIVTSSSASASSKATVVRVSSPARFIESEALAGRRSLSSRLPQYLMRAILAQLTAVAFRFDIGRRPPFRFLRPPVYHAHLASQSIAACPRRSHGLARLARQHRMTRSRLAAHR